VRILKEVPAYKGADNIVYGPFKTGEVPELPASEAEWLVKGKFAELQV